MARDEVFHKGAAFTRFKSLLGARISSSSTPVLVIWSINKATILTTQIKPNNTRISVNRNKIVNVIKIVTDIRYN
jgi:hypothetical protein